ncbi:MAG: cation diffusion facilitator family transporter [Acidimicrobiales bacterium]
MAESSTPTTRLVAAASLNTVFAVVQVLVGLWISSVVVLADAAHQVVDAIGLLTALAAISLARRPTSPTMSFGWGKSDALGGLLSGLLLLGSIVWIAVEAVRRLLDPVDVDGGGVIAIGIAAIIVNGLSLLVLPHSHAHEHGHTHPADGTATLSLRAARLHLITDLAGSFLVVAAGIGLRGSGASWIDPVASLVLCVAVLRANVDLLRSAAAELLDRAPVAISADDVAAVLGAQPGVGEVHHVHVRPLGQRRTSVTAHVVVDGDQSLHDAQHQIASLTATLERDLDVAHATLQLECHPCAAPEC